MPTEDHPLEYADFEGVIPEGEYGAGPVLVWDTGNYRNLRQEKDDGAASMEQAYADGKLEVYLEGQKLQGGYALVRTGSGDDARWLLIKMDDAEAAFFGNVIVLLRDGQIVQTGTLPELLQTPAEPFVTDFINAQRHYFH